MSQLDCKSSRFCKQKIPPSGVVLFSYTGIEQAGRMSSAPHYTDEQVMHNFSYTLGNLVKTPDSQNYRIILILWISILNIARWRLCFNTLIWCVWILECVCVTRSESVHNFASNRDTAYSTSYSTIPFCDSHTYTCEESAVNSYSCINISLAWMGSALGAIEDRATYQRIISLCLVNTKGGSISEYLNSSPAVLIRRSMLLISYSPTSKQ